MQIVVENVKNNSSDRYAGITAARLLLFLTFLHTIPSIWFLFVIAGLAPTIALLVFGVGSLFSTSQGALAMSACVLIPALIYCAIYYLVARLLCRVIFFIKRRSTRTFILVIFVCALLLTTLAPIYYFGGHSSSSWANIVELLRGLRLSNTLLIGYLAGFIAILFFLIVLQHAPNRFPKLSLSRQKRRVLVGAIAVGFFVVFISLFVYTHRILLVIKPLAEHGFTGAQLKLAQALTQKSGQEYGSYSSAKMWFEKAAAQGNITAALELVRFASNAEEREHWLRVAAKGNEPNAQFKLFKLLRRGDKSAERTREAFSWLKAAAENEHPEAQFELARLYYYGQDGRTDYEYGIAKDLEMARKWWESAAKFGHGQAMIELAWRYEKGAKGFPYDPSRARQLMDKIADGKEKGLYGFKHNENAASHWRARSEAVAKLQDEAEHGDIKAQVTLGMRILRSENPGKGGLEEGLAWLEKAAAQGDVETQHELGAMFIFGRNNVPKDFQRGRKWWNRAAQKKHVPTLKRLADAYEKGRFGYPLDLLKSKAQVELLVEAYRDGRYGVESNENKARYWESELKYIHRLFELAGGTYLPMDGLRAKAEAGDSQAQYQLARQLLVSGNKFRKEGVQWLNEAADNGHHEAQYQLVTYFNRASGIMQNNPRRGVTLLKMAAEGKHPKAMAALALAYYKGKYGLSRDLCKAKALYEDIIHAYENNLYGWDVDKRFINTQRRQLKYVTKMITPLKKGNESM
jgi:hypothetical protein